MAKMIVESPPQSPAPGGNTEMPFRYWWGRWLFPDNSTLNKKLRLPVLHADDQMGWILRSEKYHGVNEFVQEVS